MKETRQYDELDALVRDWATRMAPDNARLDELAHQIAAHGGVLLNPTDVRIEARRRSSRRSFRWVAAAGAVAASLLVVAYVVRPFQSNRVDVDAIALAPLDDRELADRARVAREFQAEFPGHLAWLMESGDDIKLGLTSDQNARPARFIAVRFVIEAQGPKDSVWKRVRAVDFVVLPEETVQTSLPSNHGARIALWTYPTPDGMISVESDLVLSAPVPIRVSSNSLLSSGAPTAIWQSEQNGVKYRVYQAAEVLDDGELG
jgi:hypothetical protein